MLSMISIMAPRAMVSMKRIGEVLEKENSIKEKEIEEQRDFDENKKGYVEFKNVSFKYPDAEENVLKNISMTLPKDLVSGICIQVDSIRFQVKKSAGPGGQDIFILTDILMLQSQCIGIFLR